MLLYKIRFRESEIKKGKLVPKTKTEFWSSEFQSIDANLFKERMEANFKVTIDRVVVEDENNQNRKFLDFDQL